MHDELYEILCYWGSRILAYYVCLNVRACLQVQIY